VLPAWLKRVFGGKSVNSDSATTFAAPAQDPLPQEPASPGAATPASKSEPEASLLAAPVIVVQPSIADAGVAAPSAPLEVLPLVSVEAPNPDGAPDKIDDIDPMPQSPAPGELPIFEKRLASPRRTKKKRYLTPETPIPSQTLNVVPFPGAPRREARDPNRDDIVYAHRAASKKQYRRVVDVIAGENQETVFYVIMHATHEPPRSISHFKIAENSRMCTLSSWQLWCGKNDAVIWSQPEAARNPYRAPPHETQPDPDERQPSIFATRS
jgi:hypothetical protein